jgi:hypothetical protein
MRSRIDVPQRCQTLLRCLTPLERTASRSRTPLSICDEGAATRRGEIRGGRALFPPAPGGAGKTIDAMT